MKYIFDIDGTICSQRNGDYENAIPYTLRIKMVNELFEQGHEIVYWTARGMNYFKGDVQKCYDMWYKFTEKQLNLWNCKYHQLLLGKPTYDKWVDDKCVNSDSYFGKVHIEE